MADRIEDNKMYSGEAYTESGKEKNYVLKGHICYSETPSGLRTMESGYLVCAGGRSAGVWKELPEIYANLPLTDYGDRLIIPGLTDLHIHAPQYPFRGLGMDLELLDWLNTRAFPEEAKYRDGEYAQKAYSIFADRMRHSATTRACIFATMHREATEILMDRMEATGLKTMVGKVNMDRNSPDYLKEEGAEQSAEETRRWLRDIKGHYRNTEPILTPRFIPSCSDELMKKLKEIQEEYRLPVQSHLSENQGEIAWVQKLCPWSEFYGDAYDRFGLFGGETKTVMAHCVWPTEEEMERMKERDVYIAHCPESNTNLSSGIAPVREYLDRGIKAGLGSDVAAGTGESVFRAMAEAIKVSKLRWRLMDESRKPLTLEEAFYLGTKGGGSFFGKVGSFEEGYELDAVVLDDTLLAHPQPLTVKERLERMVYLSDERHIAAKYVAGTKVL